MPLPSLSPDKARNLQARYRRIADRGMTAYVLRVSPLCFFLMSACFLLAVRVIDGTTRILFHSQLLLGSLLFWLLLVSILIPMVAFRRLILPFTQP